MTEYEEILIYLAENPPHVDGERHVHASMLELLANCIRDEKPITEVMPQSLAAQLNEGHLTHLY